jgi:geranylgeranyl transferase type-2 subunit alpha
MHGRKRVDKSAPAEPEEERQERLKKIAKYTKLSETVLGLRAAQVMTPEAFALTTKLLEINPEIYTLWNYRRDMLLHFFAQGYIHPWGCERACL